MLPQLQLYQLRAQLRVHPVLERKRKDFNFVFNIKSGAFRAVAARRLAWLIARAGEAGGMSDSRASVPLGPMADAPATHPRVQQLYIITDKSPWYTLVENKDGVTVGDVINRTTVE